MFECDWYIVAKWHYMVHRSSTLAQIMACCLMTPSHYLNQSWLLSNGVKIKASVVMMYLKNLLILFCWFSIKDYIQMSSRKSFILWSLSSGVPWEDGLHLLNLRWLSCGDWKTHLISLDFSVQKHFVFRYVWFSKMINRDCYIVYVIVYANTS